MPVQLRLLAPGSGKVMAEGTTYDESHDMNDHMIISLPERTMAIIQTKTPDGMYHTIGRTDFEKKQKLVEIKVK